jgi:hypothetical protein
VVVATRDDEPFALAGAGKLQDDAVLQVQVRRLIADAKSQRFIDSFAGQWLLLRNVLGERGRVEDPPNKANMMAASPRKSPRTAMFAEGTALFRHILTCSVDRLWTSSILHVSKSKSLIKHYGISSSPGPEMRFSTASGRGGVLTSWRAAGAGIPHPRTSPPKCVVGC